MTTEEKVLGTIGVGVRGRRRLHKLCFTQKRVIVSSLLTGGTPQMALIATLVVVAGISICAGILFLALTVLGLFLSPRPVWFSAGLILILVPWGLASLWRRQREEKLSKSPPASILMADKKSFEIPYSDITRLEVGRVGSAHKIKILTISEEHEFKLADKKQLTHLLYLVRGLLPESTIILPNSKK